MKKQIGLMTLTLLLSAPAVAGGAGAPVAKPKPAACKSIAQVIGADANFSTLATAIDAAGATAALNGQGSYTVFAPTNAAFAKVPSDQLADLLNDPEALKALVFYHVVGEKATAAQIRQVSGGTTVQGAEIKVSVSGSKLMINNATVTKTDVSACNGMIQVIDTVLMPPAEAKDAAPAPAAEAPAPAEPAPAEAPATEAPAPAQASAAFDITSIPALPPGGAATAASTTEAPATEAPATEATTTETTTEAPATEATTAEAPATESTEAVAANTIYDLLAADDQYSIFVGLLSDADLTEVLTSGEYTVFAPNDAAFEALPEEALSAISSDPAALKKFVQYYIVNKKVSTEQVSAGEEIKTLEGSALNLGTATLQTAVTADNGVIFPIDAVILPEDFVIPTPAN